MKFNFLTGNNKELIVDLVGQYSGQEISSSTLLYGSGCAAKNITNHLLSFNVL